MIAQTALEHIKLVAEAAQADDPHPVLAAVLATLTGNVVTGTPYVVTAEILNVRSGPGITYPSVGSVKKGEILTVYAVQNGWAKHNHGGWSSAAWLLKKYGG